MSDLVCNDCRRITSGRCSRHAQWGNYHSPQWTSHSQPTVAGASPMTPLLSELKGLSEKWEQKADRFDAEAGTARADAQRELNPRTGELAASLEWEASRLRDCKAELDALLAAHAGVEPTPSASPG